MTPARLVPLGLLFLTGLVLVWDYLDRPPPPAPPPAGESAADRLAAVRRGFAGPPDPAPDPKAAELFAVLGTAARRRDPAATDRWDFARLFAEVRQADVSVRPALTADSAGPSQQMLAAVWEAARAGWLGRGWDRTAVRRLDPLPGGGAVACVRHSGQGDHVPARWWLTRSPDGWKVYDVEDVRVGVRLSHQLAALLGPGDRPAADAAAVARGLDALSAAGLALADRDAAAADKALGPARAAPFAPPHRLALCLAEAAVALGRDRPADALGWADRADAVRPGTPAADLLRAAACDRQGKWADAAAAAGRAVAALGPDPRGSLLLGRALAELGRPLDAVAELTAAAAEFPDVPELAAAAERMVGR